MRKSLEIQNWMRSITERSLVTLVPYVESNEVEIMIGNRSGRSYSAFRPL